MKSCYLIQRLEQPRNGKNAELINAFSFGGGGLKNGGLSQEAMKLFSVIMNFDYMGSAEFEWGAVPEAFKKLAKLAAENKLTTFSVTVKGKPVYAICAKDLAVELQDWIDKEMKGKNGHTKERVYFKDAIEGDEYTRTVGWLELANPWMLFIDKAMFEGCCKLFGISESVTLY